MPAAGTMTLAQSLNAVASDLLPWLNALSARPDKQSQADAASLTRLINTLLGDSMQANALDLEAKLSADDVAARRLATFTARADDQAQAIARAQTHLAKVLKLGTDVGTLFVAGASANFGGAASALFDMCGDLGITVT